MKKIGILTFMQNNYGAVLQAYALQRYLRSNSNHDIEVIDFTTDKHLSNNKIYKKRSSSLFQWFVYLILTTFRYKQLHCRKRRIEVFKRKYINFSKRYSTQEELLSNPPQKDIYITGSDQVFNPNSSYLPVYYLDFKRHMGLKVAYAPSFGISTFDLQLKNRVSKYLRDFDALSCREKAGADFISEIVEKDVPTVVDPTMLLTKQEWLKVTNKPEYKYKYIFVYDLNGAEKLIDIAQKLKGETGFRIVCLTNKVQKFYKVDKQIYDAGPCEFLGWVANAEYVITDSFHGTVFSIIFERQFYSYVALTATSSRLDNLLSLYNLRNRIVTGNNSIDGEIISYPLPILDILTTSHEFIRNNIIY